MSSGDKSKTSSQTDGKAAQGKKSEMGMMSYKVGGSCMGLLLQWFPPKPQWDVFSLSCPRPLLSVHWLICPLQMYVFDQENFQGRMIEISNECMNVCEMGMDRVRSLRVECGP